MKIANSRDKARSERLKCTWQNGKIKKIEKYRGCEQQERKRMRAARGFLREPPFLAFAKLPPVIPCATRRANERVANVYARKIAPQTHSILLSLSLNSDNGLAVYLM